LKRRKIPDMRGPVKFPPVMGMATLFPLGPVPTVIALPSAQSSEYKKVSPGVAGVAAAQRCADRESRVATIKDFIVKPYWLPMYSSGLEFKNCDGNKVERYLGAVSRRSTPGFKYLWYTI
jgi:hypothetical protein